MTLPPGFALHRGWRAWYAVAGLAETLPLEQRQITVFGKTHDVPRLTAWMGGTLMTSSSWETTRPSRVFLWAPRVDSV